MKKKTVLITSDDGYASLGFRTLIRLLKNDFDVAFAVTQLQQSGVGGLVHVKDGCMWKRAVIEGVEGVIVDGSPVDAVDCARGVYEKKFDCVVSGINMGVNIGGSVISSGTFSAAYSAVNFGGAEKAIAVSWDVDVSMQFRDHAESDIHAGYDEHPGKEAIMIVKKALAKNLWGAVMLNINIPEKKSKGIRLTRLDVPSLDYWARGIPDEATGKLTYPDINHADSGVPGSDAEAIGQGFISVTPIDITMTDETSFARMKKML